MWILGVLAGVALILGVLVDGFEVIIQPRRITHRYRYVRLYYTNLWALWRVLALRFPAGKRRQDLLSLFGPLSLLGLLGTWVGGLVTGFGVLHWSLGSPLQMANGEPSLPTYLYLSGTTFFTLGYGDITPTGALGRVLAVLESGLGFGFLAVVVSYLPVLFQAFSQREAVISLLDARASSPPSAAQALLRLAKAGNPAAIDPLLASWERWAAELLESHLSFPVLSYYRSQHDNQSWLAALTAMLDTCALLIAGGTGRGAYQAQLTFAMARHAAVDLTLVLKTKPQMPELDRLPAGSLTRLRQALREAGLELRGGPAADREFAALRAAYEPFVHALAQNFLFTLPPIVPAEPIVDNWQRSAWMPHPSGIGNLLDSSGDSDHFGE
jgi:hypothetical protein